MNRSVGLLEWLMAWYSSQCNGDWEHQHGIRIDTLDNPGWSLNVDLHETPHENQVLSARMTERSDNDWTFVEVKDFTFRARGGPGNLTEMVRLFAEFIAEHSAP
jgi:Immunity protein 53